MRPTLPATLFATTLTAAFAVPALAAPPLVATDTPISAALVAEVLGDLGAPRTLLPAGSGVHSHQMRPSEAAALQSADLLVWFGPELTPWLTRAAETRPQGSDLRLLGVEGTYLQPYGASEAGGDSHDQDDAHQDEDAHAGDHDHSHGHSHDHDHAHDDDHDHGHDGIDPHAWLDPANAATWLTAIAARLSEIDPDNAATYAANADKAKAGYATLDARLADRLAPLAGQSFVVFHDAYGYFTSHYGLSPAIAVALGDATSPSAARIAGVREQIVHSGATCAFPEFGQDSGLIGTAIEGSGARLGGTLDPAGIAVEPGPTLLADALEGLATTLADCLSASQ